MDTSRTGPWGLYSQQKFVPSAKEKIWPTLLSKGGHFCKSRQCPTSPVHLTLPTLASTEVRRTEVRSDRHNRLLCQPTMENNPSVVEAFKNEPRGEMSGHFANVGWCHMVAPTSKTARPWHPHSASSSISRTVSERLGRAHAKAKVAPDLSTFIRKTLESQEVQTEAINFFLGQHKSLNRYNNAFKLLWGIAAENKVDILTCPMSQLAAQIIALHAVAPAQARNAYSGLILIPGFDQLRFSPLLSNCKKMWSESNVRYGAFWDGHAVCCKSL